MTAKPRPTRRWEQALDGALYRISGAMVGPRFVNAQREMERAQWLPREELQARMEARLAPLLQHAARHVPFYRELYRQGGLAPDALGTVADLARLPIVSKATHREHPPDYFLAANLPACRRLERRTSGSTGEPFRFYFDRQAIPHLMACNVLGDTWFGRRPFERSIRIRAPLAAVPALPAGTPAAFRLRQAVTTGLRALRTALIHREIWVWEMDRERAEAIYREIEAFRPVYLHGYTSTLALLAEEMLRRGRRLSRPVRAVVTGAETLSPARRQSIEQYFNAPIINRYALREFGSFIAQSCPQDPERFHVNTERVVWETVRADGTPAAPGEIGRVVVTDLHNEVMPFIRYDTGDLEVAGCEDRCACGRSFPLVGPVEGRSQEYLRTPSGKVISPATLGHYLFVYHGRQCEVREYQLVQEEPGRARLRVVPAAGMEGEQQERLRQDLARLLEPLLGREMVIAVEMATEIPPEPSGKRAIIRVAAGSRQPAEAIR